MKRNLVTFAALIVLIGSAGIGANILLDSLSSGVAALLSWGLFILEIWFIFDLVVQLIYWFAGIPAGTKKLNHQQAGIVNKYWMTWLIAALTTGLVYILLFERDHLSGSLLLLGGSALLILLGSLYQRQRIMGHTKKELFQ
jgi:hypothetical protein